MNKLNGKITKSATLRGAMTRGVGGGTYVEANPEGEATNTLEKLMVEDTIYNIRNVPDASSAHNGDVLTKIASGVAWLPPTKELPTYTSGDNGKVLKIVNGSPTWDYLVKYSTDEHVVGVWVDGSPIYKKTVVLTNLSLQEGSNNFALSRFNISDVKYVIEDPTGFVKISGSDIRTYPFGSAYSLKAYATPNNLVIERTGNNLSVAEFTATITYTKVGE